MQLSDARKRGAHPVRMAFCPICGGCLKETGNSYYCDKCKAVFRISVEYSTDSPVLRGKDES